MRDEVSAAAKAMVGMCRDASATTSGSVVGGPKFHSIDHDASILNITDLTLELIQQYVGMNNWENVLAFGSVQIMERCHKSVSFEDWCGTNGGR
jgi:hypothetical protein